MAKKESSEVRRQQIADAALTVIARSGLARLTAAEIAKEVGISDGGLFRHFPDKQAIIMAAIERAEELLFEHLPDAANPLVRLREFFLQRVSQLHGRAGIARILFSDQLTHAAGHQGAQRVAAIKLRSLAFIRTCLSEAKASGLLRAGSVAEDLIMIIQGTALAFAFLGQDSATKKISPARIARVWSSLEDIIGNDIPGR